MYEYGLSESVRIHPPTEHIEEKYVDSSIFCYESKFEGFGLVLAEAMSCGIPCVSFNCPYGPSQIIKDREDGFLVENDNYEKLADKLFFLIENDNIRKQMGLNAIKNIQRYSPNIIMPKWNNLFEDLIRHK
nr:glycosyltransferase [Phocaeicola paurosaccharolyticus]